MHRKQIQRFSSREEAGRKLAKHLAQFSGFGDTIVLAMPNGGVPVGAEVAEFLNKPFDVLFVEKITAPGCGGMPLGAITGGGVRMLNCAMIDRLSLSQAEISTAVLQGSLKLARREKQCRGHYPPLEIADRTVILVDDGTTPYTVIRDAIRLLRRRHAERIIVAIPSACSRTISDLRFEADEVVTLAESPATQTKEKPLKPFPTMTDEEVRRLLSGRCTTAGAGN